MNHNKKYTVHARMGGNLRRALLGWGGVRRGPSCSAITKHDGNDKIIKGKQGKMTGNVCYDTSPLFPPKFETGGLDKAKPGEKKNNGCRRCPRPLQMRALPNAVGDAMPPPMFFPVGRGSYAHSHITYRQQRRHIYLQPTQLSLRRQLKTGGDIGNK